jgi:hypothetical protein
MKDYKFLQLFLKHRKKKDKKTQELQNEAFALDLAIKSQIDIYNGNIAIEQIKPSITATEQIGKSKEQILSPLFAIMLALLGFAMDEVIVTCASTDVRDWSMTFLAFVLIFAVLFLLLLWSAFIRAVVSFDDKPEVPAVNKEESKGKKLIHGLKRWLVRLNPIKVSLCTVVLNVGMLSLISLLHPSVFWSYILYILSFLPLLVVAALRTFSDKSFKSYSYVFIFKHFVLLVVLSLLLTVVFWGTVSYSPAVKNMAVNYESCTLIKYWLMLVVFIAGLCLPYIGPFIGYQYVLKYAKKQTQEKAKFIDSIKDKITKDLDDICKRIASNI